jgi:lysophospholipase L1-like esterase
MIFKTIGTNNAAPTTVEDIAHGVREAVTELLGKMPNTKVILLALLPRDSLHDKVRQVNEAIKTLNNDKNVFFLDMWSAYETDGKLHTELYNDDKLHLSPKGYEVWQQTMEPVLKKLDPTL